MVKNIRVSQILLTYPQCTASKEELMEFLRSLGIVQSCIIAHEEHVKTEGHHLHAWVKLTESKQFNINTWAHFWDFNGYHGNYQKVTCNPASVARVVNYVVAEGDFISFGCDVNALLHPDSKKKKYTYEIFDMSRHDVIANGSIAPSNLCSYVKNKAAYDLLTFDEKTHWTKRCKGIWLWGDAGVGKTRYAHAFGREVGSYYEKGPSKFWDGYEGQEVIIFDEARSAALFEAGYINRWADVYPCKAEIKGGSIWLKHRYFIVTSNISPEDFCMHSGTFDSKLYDAITRRFIVREVRKCDLPEDHPYIDFHPEDVFDNPWCTEDEALGPKEDVSSSRDAAEPLGSQAPDVSQSAAPIEPSSPPASKIAPSMDFQNPFPF